ncbi:MAG: hypothetical protein KBC62_04825 [Candidatus Pacebacteria bacterium]|nr:hypothetical protein [Candidatus Paceibacterota bacterium]MBP9843292.1 hypothetical protein [Candidatus Paceibacterota bacterium]
MSQKTIILTVILFTLIVLGMFTFARIRSAELHTSLPDGKLNNSLRTVLV